MPPLQNAIGAPLSVLKNLTDFTMNTASGAPQRVDPYGSNLKKLMLSSAPPPGDERAVRAIELRT